MLLGIGLQLDARGERIAREQLVADEGHAFDLVAGAFVDHEAEREPLVLFVELF